MDAVTMYLEAADVLLDGYVEISMYSEVFEAGDEKVQEAMKSNAEIEEKSMNLIQKAIKGIKAMFAKIREIVDNVLSYLHADAGTKSAYQKFCDEIKNNPEFAKKKVSFKAYSEIAKQWQDELESEERQYRNLKDEELENKEGIAKDIENAWITARNKIKDVGKLAVKEIAVEALMQEAKTCRDGALSARNKLRWYETLIGSLEGELGKKEAKKVKKKMKRLSSRCSLIRRLAGGVEKEWLTWKDALKNVFSVSGVSDVLNRNKDIRKAVGTTVAKTTAEVARVGAKGAAKGAEDSYEADRKLTKYEKKAGKQISKIKQVMNDENLRADQKATYLKRQKAKIPKFEDD